MLIYAFLLILLLRPSWGLWGLFSIAAAVLFVLSAMNAGLPPEAAAVGALIQGTIFCGLGAAIVGIRLAFKKGRSRQDKEVDAELERIRAEAAAREAQQQQQPPPQ